MNNKVIVSVLAALIIIGGIAYASTLRKASAPKSAVVETVDPAPSPSAISESSTSKNCGTDMGCFIAEANTCGPASVDFTAIILKGLTGTSHIVIGKSTKAGSCTFSQRTDKVTVDGKSDNSVVGTTVTCPAVPSVKLVTVLTNWDESTFGSDDFDGYNCKTTLPKSLIDAMAKEESMPPAANQFDNPDSTVETFTGLGEGSSVGRNGYQFYVSGVTSDSTTLKLRGETANDTLPPATTVTLTKNTPQTFFGFMFTLTSNAQNKYGDYLGTIIVQKL